MFAMRRFVLVLLGWLPWLAPAVVAAQASDNVFPPLIQGKGKFDYLGLKSCNATNCHKADKPRAAKVARNEYSIWMKDDPHSKAFENIHVKHPLARPMLERLGIVRDGKIIDKIGYESCEKCHNLSEIVNGEKLKQGVSCEACHGPSSIWRSEHYKVGFNAAKGAALGMIDTDNVFIRARLCVQCHVGAADREVNHDLIAAGHPQLRFEMAAYHAIYPKHWNDPFERKAKDHLELQLWAAGQIAAAETSLAQLEARAKRVASNASKPLGAAWPEFSETDCFACHHDLTSPSWRQQRGFAGRKPGDLPWGSWYFGLIDRLAEKDPGSPDAKEFRANLAQLRKTMQDRISPDPGLVGKQARSARESLAKWAKADGALVAAAAKPAKLQEVFNSVAADKGESGLAAEAAVETWETATQVYLAVSALDKARRDERRKQKVADSPADQTAAALIKQLRLDLAHAAGYDSPREFSGLPEGGGGQPSPREKVRSALLDVFEPLRPRGGK